MCLPQRIPIPSQVDTAIGCGHSLLRPPSGGRLRKCGMLSHSHLLIPQQCASPSSRALDLTRTRTSYRALTLAALVPSHTCTPTLSVPLDSNLLQEPADMPPVLPSTPDAQPHPETELLNVDPDTPLSPSDHDMGYDEQFVKPEGRPGDTAALWAAYVSLRSIFLCQFADPEHPFICASAVPWPGVRRGGCLSHD